MTASLSKQQIDSYWEDGFIFPLPVISAAQASDYRSQMEAIESIDQTQPLPRTVKEYLRTHSEVVMPMAAELARHPAVLDAVESIIGPNLMIWGAEFFIKDARSPALVSMHQDLTYWGFGETSNQVTAWIALSPSTVESGCVDLVKSSHKNPILPHNDTQAENNLLSRGQEVSVKVLDEDRTHVELAPGEMSLHHGLTIHGSNPNTSDDRRIGFAVRYINPEAQQQSVNREFAILVRGVDTSAAFIHYAPPESLFSEASLALYEQIRGEQSKILMSNLKKP